MVRAPLSRPGTPLARWPAVLEALRAREVEPEPLPAEGLEAFENRMGTALMLLFRETRDALVFEALYAVTSGAVLAWIRGLLGREAPQLDPREVLQDTFVNVYRYPGAFRADHGGSFRVWVRTIAGNVLRRSARARPRALSLETTDHAEIEDGRRGPADALQNEDEARRLREAWFLLLGHYARAWAELGDRDRTTLHMVEVEGLSYQEAGRILDVGRSNLKMIVFRSRRRIARRMRAAMGLEPVAAG